jgi:hypothetical protein
VEFYCRIFLIILKKGVFLEFYCQQPHLIMREILHIYFVWQYIYIEAVGKSGLHEIYSSAPAPVVAWNTRPFLFCIICFEYFSIESLFLLHAIYIYITKFINSLCAASSLHTQNVQSFHYVHFYGYWYWICQAWPLQAYLQYI